MKVGSWVIALLAWLSLFAPSAVSASHPDALASGFCSNDSVIDYEAPFKAMRSTHRLPPSGQLPFAPKGIEIGLIGFSRLAVEGGGVGFRLFDGPGLNPARRIGWVITARLSLVDRRGHIRRVVRRRQQEVERVAGLESLRAWFEVGPRPDLYRVDIAFRRRSERLGHYAEYFRVLPRRVEMRMATDRPEARLGGELAFRLENPGTATLTYGYPYEVELLQGDGWVFAPSLTPDGWILPELFLLAGTASACQTISIPSNAEPDHYRVVKTISIPDGRNGKDRTLVAEFDVLP